MTSYDQSTPVVSTTPLKLYSCHLVAKPFLSDLVFFARAPSFTASRAARYRASHDLPQWSSTPGAPAVEDRAAQLPRGSSCGWRFLRPRPGGCGVAGAGKGDAGASGEHGWLPGGGAEDGEDHLGQACEGSEAEGRTEAGLKKLPTGSNNFQI